MSVKAVEKLANTDQLLFLALLKQVGSPKRMKCKTTFAMGDVNAHGLVEGCIPRTIT